MGYWLNYILVTRKKYTHQLLLALGVLVLKFTNEKGDVSKYREVATVLLSYARIPYLLRRNVSAPSQRLCRKIHDG